LRWFPKFRWLQLSWRIDVGFYFNQVNVIWVLSFYLHFLFHLLESDINVLTFHYVCVVFSFLFALENVDKLLWNLTCLVKSHELLILDFHSVKSWWLLRSFILRFIGHVLESLDNSIYAEWSMRHFDGLIHVSSIVPGSKTLGVFRRDNSTLNLTFVKVTRLIRSFRTLHCKNNIFRHLWNCSMLSSRVKLDDIMWSKNLCFEVRFVLGQTMLLERKLWVLWLASSMTLQLRQILLFKARQFLSAPFCWCMYFSSRKVWNICLCFEIS